MLSEEHVVFDADHVALVRRVVVVQVLQDFQLHARLVLELPLVADHLDGHCLLGLVVQTLDCLSEASLAEEGEHLVAEGDVVVEDDLVVALLVVEPVVKDAHLLETLFVALHLLGRSLFDDVAFDLLFTVLAQIVNFVAKPFDLDLFVIVQVIAKELNGI
jgi:hypothetical protein